MRESQLTLTPSYHSQTDDAGHLRGTVSMLLVFGADTATVPQRQGLWVEVMKCLTRNGNWLPGEDVAAIAAWLERVQASSYAPRIVSRIRSKQIDDFRTLFLPQRLAVAIELLELASTTPVRFRALELLDFVGAGVATPADPLDIITRRVTQPDGWRVDDADRDAFVSFARAALATESWPGNRASHYLAARPGLAALL